MHCDKSGEMTSLWVLALIALIVPNTVGKYTEGHLKTHQNWAFLARFCFLSEDGEFQYEIEYSEEDGPVNLLLYYDTFDQWPSVYRTNKTCRQKESVLNISNSQIVNLTSDWDASGCVKQNIKSNSFGLIRGPNVIRCTRTRRFRTARERWWFIAVSNCNSTKGLNVAYKFLMTNGPPGDYWHEHVSADEFYILPILIAYSVSYLFLILAVAICSVELKSRQFFHATYKLYIVSIVLQEIGVITQGVAYLRYAWHGIEYSRVKNLGRIAEAASEISFLLLLLLLAKGYTVTRGRLRLGSSIKLTVFICLYVVLTLCLFIYEKEYFDPGEVLYLYESPAGYGVITLRITAWWMFIYSTVFTLKHYPEKASFYYPFNLMGTLWFVAGPTFILAANNLIDKWVRESVVYGAMHFITFAGHVLFLLITMPSKANKNFPYHVRTNQIGIMEMSGVAGNNSLYNFGHHNYEPQSRAVPIDLFTVSKKLEMDSNGLEFETNPYPHEIRGYTQTILLPFTIRDGPDGDFEVTREDSPVDLKTESNNSAVGTKSAGVYRPPRPYPDRLVMSAGDQRPDSYAPSVPLEEYEKDYHLGSASTMSAATAERNLEEDERRQREAMTVSKLTQMFMAQSLRQPD